jgi:hypothetical protein
VSSCASPTYQDVTKEENATHDEDDYLLIVSNLS